MSRRHLRLLRDTALSLVLGWGVMAGGNRLLPDSLAFPLWLVTQAVFFVIAALVVLTVMQAHLIFAPSELLRDLPLQLPHDARELWLEGNPSVHALWFPAPGQTKALLYCHGNAGHLGHRIASAEGLRQALEISILAFDYPGFGKSPGSPSERSCYASGETALAWLKTQGFAEEQIVLLGKSLGGGVATELARRHPTVSALILSRTFCSIPDMARGLYKIRLGPLVRHRFDNLSKLPHIHVPTLFIYGSDDTLCPSILGERLHARANAPKHLLVLQGDHHVSPDDERFYSAVRNWLT
ncbi:alpha/beta hydrolase [Armatimonas sp.]|uniref:alpha/beta hydrolase n=1 Tax=Armatimonas sp. TaxID=1872638 RepID=UPI00286B24CD|nr:alpha/beta hydrolase [Armatimonas sp.]